MPHRGLIAKKSIGPFPLIVYSLEIPVSRTWFQGLVEFILEWNHAASKDWKSHLESDSLCITILQKPLSSEMCAL